MAEEEVKFSEFIENTTPALTDEVVGLQSGVNKRTTLQRVKDLLNPFYDIHTVAIELYGAVGNGIADDTQAFINAIAAGERHIVGDSGATYLVSREIRTPSNFIWDGQYSTIKRADGVSSTLSVAGTSGTNTVTVVDASGFRVGDHVGLKNTTGANSGFRWNQIANWASGQTTITDIVGNTITLEDNLQGTQDGVITTTWPIGSTLFTVNNIFIGTSSLNENVQYLNTTFDGNKANNDFNYSWSLSSSVNCLSYKSVIKNCTFINSPHETVFLAGPAIIDNCEYADLNGSFVHIGVNGDVGHEDVKIWNCRGENSNIKSSSLETGHSEGIVTLSAGPYNVWIQNNHFRTAVAGRLCAKPIPNTDPLNTRDKIWILSNKTEDLLGITDVALTLGANGHDLRIEGNEFLNSGHLTIEATEANNFFRDEINAQKVAVISGNSFRDTQIYCANVAGLIIANNTLDYTSTFVPSTNNIFIKSAIVVKGYNVNVHDNILNLPTTAIADLRCGITALCVVYNNLDGTNGFIKNSSSVDQPFFYGQNVSIKNNIVANGTYGIVSINSNNPADNSNSGAQRIGWTIAGNTIQMNTVTGSTGIMVGAGVVCEHNTVIGYGGTTIRGIQAFGASSTNFGSIYGAIVQNNTVMGTLTDSIIYGMVALNGYNNIIINNLVTKAVTDVGAGAGNVASGNTVLVIASQAIPRQPLFAYPERY